MRAADCFRESLHAARAGPVIPSDAETSQSTNPNESKATARQPTAKPIQKFFVEIIKEFSNSLIFLLTSESHIIILQRMNGDNTKNRDRVSITIPRDTYKRIRAFSKQQRRNFSNAISLLADMALDELAKNSNGSQATPTKK